LLRGIALLVALEPSRKVVVEKVLVESGLVGGESLILSVILVFVVFLERAGSPAKLLDHPSETVAREVREERRKFLPYALLLRILAHERGQVPNSQLRHVAVDAVHDLFGEGVVAAESSLKHLQQQRVNIVLAVHIKPPGVQLFMFVLARDDGGEAAHHCELQLRQLRVLRGEGQHR